MRKLKILVTALLVCCLTVSVAGTLAYFTAEEQAHNVITTGNVAIELKETAIGSDGKEHPFQNVENLVPGAEESKIVRVTNTGSNEVWVRLSVDTVIALPEGTADASLISFDINTEHWTEKDGFYYYNEILKPGETSEALFTKVTFSKDMGNEYKNSKISVNIAAHAVQSDNNGQKVTDAIGWPAVG